LQGIDNLARWATRLQHGKLRYYLATMLAATLVLILVLSDAAPALNWEAVTWPTFTYSSEIRLLKIAALLVIAGTALACVLLVNDFFAILAFGASGLGVAVLMALEPAPDVALVQIVVDILLVIILVLALSQLPSRRLRDIHQLVFKRHRGGIVRDALISSAFGIVVMFMTLTALLERPRTSELTLFFQVNAKPLVGSKSIVGAILTDFRGVDTLIEIVVFGLAGLGIYTLIWFAGRKFNAACPVDDTCGWPSVPDFSTLGIGGLPVSELLRGLAVIVLPLAMTIGVCDLLYGHDQPGDGFTAGVIVSIGIGFWYVAFGYHDTRRRLPWLQPSAFIGWGLFLALLSGIAAAVVTGHFFGNADFGKMLALPLPGGVHLSSSFLFEAAIALYVVGSVSHMLNTLGHPEEEETLWKS